MTSDLRMDSEVKDGRMVQVPREVLSRIVSDPYYYRETERDEGELDESLCFGCSAHEHEPHNPECPMVELQAALATEQECGTATVEVGQGFYFGGKTLILRDINEDMAVATFDYAPRDEAGTLRTLAAASSPAPAPAEAESREEVDALIGRLTRYVAPDWERLNGEERRLYGTLFSCARAYRDALIEVANLASTRASYLQAFAACRALAPAPAEGTGT
ncbi:hypothetical protein [Deinococcus sp. QL22]|uniref:hypothetical protein n=1 Tax=Deinococcus sp. QL22 TaxID=2939437 RepID=UPI0020177C43|nr:hypothetical protein [Deinococcus sp. QL22]UQN10316.1 hypothetical protein M1R55_29635 [Deinococcus sp. QL22]UQN10450.1 hypothetical protein M1R55_28960 [Deinococcus sp. QL22]